jgi:hypothetical protein
MLRRRFNTGIRVEKTKHRRLYNYKLCILPTQYVYSWCDITERPYLPPINCVNWLVFIMKKHCVCCEVENEILIVSFRVQQRIYNFDVSEINYSCVCTASSETASRNCVCTSSPAVAVRSLHLLLSLLPLKFGSVFP